MRFLIDADLPRSVSAVIEKYGHEAQDVRDIGLAAATDAEIAEHAKKERLCLLTGDVGFGDIRNYPPKEYAGLVVLRTAKNATATAISRLLRSFLQQSDLIEELPGRLAVVEWGKVRVRPIT